MKKVIYIILTVLISIWFSGCGSCNNVENQGKSVKEDQAENDQSGQPSMEVQTDTQPDDTGSVDVDLAKLSSTIVYSKVYNMVSVPESYLGKRVRMKGLFSYAEENGRYYFACVISDATACCARGIEFVLKDERKFPDEYPSKGTEITVVGVFDTYREGSYQYCQLIDAVIE